MECLFSHWVGGRCIRWIVYFHNNLQKESGLESTLRVGQIQVGKSMLLSMSGGVLEELAGNQSTHIVKQAHHSDLPRKDQL